MPKKKGGRGVKEERKKGGKIQYKNTSWGVTGALRYLGVITTPTNHFLRCTAVIAVCAASQ